MAVPANAVGVAMLMIMSMGVAAMIMVVIVRVVMIVIMIVVPMRVVILGHIPMCHPARQGSTACDQPLRPSRRL